jgi:hypothetical protein
MFQPFRADRATTPNNSAEQRARKIRTPHAAKLRRIYDLRAANPWCRRRLHY